MRKRITSMLVTVLVACFLLAGCGTGTSQKKYVIGVCANDLSNPYFVTLIDGMKDKAKELGNIDILVEDPKTDAAKQLSIIEDFVTQQVDGIVIIPFDTTSANQAVADVYKEGKIKVLCQSGKIDNANTNVSAKNYDMGFCIGETAGAYIASELGGEAEVGILDFPKNPDIIAREKGITEGILSKAPNAKVVATAAAATADDGASATEAFLQAHPKMSVIIGINDAGALGALSAVQADANANPKFFIGGIDCLDQAISEINKGGFYKATVDNAPYDNGKFDVELMAKMFAGEKVDNDYPVEVKAVTKDNVAQYIK